MDLQIFDSTRGLATAAAQHFVAESIAAVSRKGFFTVALSGGSTPKSLYRLLADPREPFRDQIPWSNSHFFWSDERHVPPDHPESNYRMASETMLSRVQTNVHRVAGENPDAADAADEYEQTLREFFSLKDGVPQLDLILLGLGADGHTASIFPGSDVLREHTRLVAAPWVEKLNSYRITMTPPLLNNGSSILFLVSGAEKAETVREVLRGDSNPDLYPAQIIQPTAGKLSWLLDQPAAVLL